MPAIVRRKVYEKHYRIIKIFYMKLIVMTLLLFSNAVCFAQNKSDSVRLFFHYGFGYHNQSFNGLNNRIANRPEYEKLGSSIVSINAGWNIERHHVMLNSNFVFGNSLTGDANKRSSSLSLFGIELNLGYNFSRNQNIRIYPFAGISYNAYLARLNKDVSSIPFDSVLQSNAVQQRTEPVTFTNGLLCYQAGFAVDFIKQRGRYIRSIGIRASYGGSFTGETWRINETQLLQNAPSDKVKQFNVSLQFGVGRSRRTSM